MESAVLTNKDEIENIEGILIGITDHNPPPLSYVSRTWGAHVGSIKGTVLYYISCESESSGCGDTTLTDDQTVVRLAGIPPVEYPPIEKNVAIWEDMATRIGYKWYMRCDSDTFIVTNGLKRTLDTMNPYRDLYIGVAGHGREHERKKLNISSPFAQGGFCEIVSFNALHMIRKSYRNTVEQSRAVLSKHNMHTDVEFGRLMNRYGVKLTEWKDYFNVAKITGFVEGTVKMKSVSGSQLSQVVEHKHTIYHPVKSYTAMTTLYDAFYNLRNTFESKCAVSPLAYATYTSCNEKKLVDECSRNKNECPPVHMHFGKHTISGFVNKAYVITISNSDDMAKRLIKNLNKHNVNASVFYGVNGNDELYSNENHLTKGEVGYRMSIKKILENAIRMRYKRIAIFDNDALVHNNFEILWRQLIQSERCTGFLHDDDIGGILLLGSTEWRMDSWRYIEYYEKNNTHPNDKCYNAHSKTMGSYAFIISSHVYQHVLDWFDVSDKPFDHIYFHLMKKGYPVRAAFPFLIIQNTSHTSTINPDRTQLSFEERARIHKWDLSQFSL